LWGEAEDGSMRVNCIYCNYFIISCISISIRLSINKMVVFGVYLKIV
jgi:hypothetical protein